jgi:uncharacterized membrane protein
MDQPIRPPDILATPVPLNGLVGTARSIALAAEGLGYDVKAARGLGRRIPRVAGQQASRQALTIVTGVRGGFGFKARHTDADGWDVRLRRPGWPDLDSSIAGLRLLLKAQAT